MLTSLPLSPWCSFSFLPLFPRSPGLLFAAAGTGLLDGISSKPLEMIKLRQQILPVTSAVSKGKVTAFYWLYCRLIVFPFLPSPVSIPLHSFSSSPCLTFFCIFSFFPSSLPFSPPLPSLRLYTVSSTVAVATVTAAHSTLGQSLTVRKALIS
jgi:hypothetical protein